jgi:D-serine deaminase-like pyridoxal phosphate-dependent protein
MITQPTILIDKPKALANLAEMQEKAQSAGLDFRPHFKTHQSQIIGNWFADAGVKKIAVSSVQMAKYFANVGWNDILIAFPVNLREIDTIIQLSTQIKLCVLVESEYVVNQLAKNLASPIHVSVKIDGGYGRTGINIRNFDAIRKLLNTINHQPNILLESFVIHNGHTYSATSPEDVQDIHEECLPRIAALKKEFPKVRISFGDTPSCSLCHSFEGIDELRPGNFIFYDLMQNHIGSCSLDQIAISVACPVVALHPERNEVVVYGGGVHLGKEFISNQGDEHKAYGLALHQGKAIGYVRSLSQEHGIIKYRELPQIKEGDLIHIIPVHSCMTAQYMGHYHISDGTTADHFSSANKTMGT